MSWPTVCAVLAPLLLAGAIRLLAEWQRRRTLAAVLRDAPAGSVVVQERGLGGPPMWVWVGTGPRPSEPTVVLAPAEVMVLRAGGHRE